MSTFLDETVNIVIIYKEATLPMGQFIYYIRLSTVLENFLHLLFIINFDICSTKIENS